MSDRGGLNGGHLLLAFLGGAAVGAAVVYLTTPRTGPESRKQLKELAEKSAARIEGLANDTRDVARKVPRAIQEGKEAAQKVLAADAPERG